jgi:Putative peptidoglycan binding domain/Papain-like cysteine protease AvrRpt2
MPAPLRNGARGVDVAALQVQLNLGSSPGPNLRVDGSFGRLTQAAVADFQRRANLASDGVVGPQTHAALASRTTLSVASHAVQHIAQPTRTTCWAASTAMMTRTNVAAVHARTPANMIASDGGLANSSESDQAVVTGSRFGGVHGLYCHAPMSWSVGGLVNALRRSPLMLDMLWNATDYVQGQGSPGHMIVVSAVVSNNAPDGKHTHLLVLDPWPPHRGKVSWVEYQHWTTELPTRTYRVFERR